MPSNSKVLAELSIENKETDYIDLPGGTTAQRPSPAGSGNLRYNTTTGRAEYYNGNNQWQSIDTPPSVTSISPSGAEPDDTSASIVVTGQNFQTGATAAVVASNGTVTNATTTTVNSATQITAVFNTTGLAVGSYSFKVTNAGGLSGELTSGFAISTSPAWTTSAGNIATFYSDKSGSVTLAATDAEGDSVSFALASGSSLYGGLSLNGTTGVISGNPNPDISAGGADVTNTFTIEATDGTTTVNRTFNIIIDEPLGTATNPAVSAKQLYDAGYTTSGNYYINNPFTGGSAAQVYCKMGVDVEGLGTLYHFQKFIPSNLSNFAQYSMSNATATLTTQSSTANDFTTYNYRYTTSSSGSGAAGVRQTGLTASQTDNSGIIFAIDHKVNSYGDGNNPIGDGGPSFDANLTGDVSSSTLTHSYSSEWQNGVSTSEANSAGGYFVYAIKFPRINNANVSYDNNLSGHFWYSGRGNSQANAWANLASSNAEQHNRQGTTFTIQSTNYIAFKHQGWSDVGNSAQSDCIYWVGYQI